MVHIISDTTASLPPEAVARFHLPIIPQIIHLGGQSYREGLDLNTETFLRLLRNEKGIPRTAAPPPQYFTEVFSQLVQDGEPIICIHPSSEVSGTVRSALLAAEEFPDADIRVIDSRTIAYSLGLLVIRAAEMAEQNASADTICDTIRDLMVRSRTYFRVATLEYLARGGRIGKATALLGSMLQIKPILTIHDGIIDQYARERSEHNAISRLTRIVVEQCPKNGLGSPAMMCDGSPEQQQAILPLAQQLGEVLGAGTLPIYTIPPAIITHAGPGVTGIGFLAETDHAG